MLVACVVIGLAGGVLVARLSGGDALTAYRNGAVVAEGALARALNSQISGQISPDSRIRVTATYRSRGGTYCRAFNITSPQAVGGLACRNRQEWQVQTLLNNAASAAPLLDLNKNLGANPLTPAVEAQLRAHDWQ